MDQPPLVSVVIPVYNGAPYLAEAIESVLAQKHRSVDVIVVDDGSTDDTAGVARQFGPAVGYHHQQNGGPASAMNRGVELARGAFLGFISADDVWVRDKLTYQVAMLAQHPGLDMVFGQMQHFFSPELDVEIRRTLVCPPEPMPAYSAGTLFIRSDTFRRVGGFDARLRAGEFIDWYARAMDAGLTSHLLPHVVARRRVHAGNLTVRDKTAPSSYARVLKATLDRRRALRASVAVTLSSSEALPGVVDSSSGSRRVLDP